MSDALTALIRAGRRRLNLVAGLRATAHGLAAGAALLLVAALLHRFVAPVAPIVALLLLAAPIALALHASWRARPSPQAIAQAIDRHFDTRSLFASAWTTRANAAAPATLIVGVDASARAAQLRPALAAAWPFAPSRGVAASAAAALAAAFLLAQPGHRGETHDAAPPAAANAPAARDAHAARADSAAPPALARSATPTRGDAAGDDFLETGDVAPATAPGRATPARAARDAGDAPGDAPAAAGDARTRDAALATRWSDRARRPDGSVEGGTDSTALDAPVAPPAVAPADAAALAPALSAQLPYEPVLAPALAAYVRAVARAEQQ